MCYGFFLRNQQERHRLKDATQQKEDEFRGTDHYDKFVKKKRDIFREKAIYAEKINTAFDKNESSRRQTEAVIDVYYLGSIIGDDITKLETAKDMNYIEVMRLLEKRIYNIEVPDGK